MGPLPPAGRLLCLRWILAPRRPLSHAPRLGLRRLYSTTGSAAPPFPSRARRRLLLAAASGGAAAVMVPGALVASGAGILAATTTAADDDDDDAGADAEDDDGRTDEQRMLAASRAELAAQKIPTLLAHSARWRRGLWLFVDLYIWEPAATALRFLRLLALFVPVALATPAVWCGARDPLRGGERRGALWWYGALVWAMERAGASFIKLGQWAASRTDVFPAEMCAAMSSLHDDAPPHALEATKRIVERTFGGRRFDDIFAEFDERPLGVGAIAQVYRAQLRPDLAVLADEAGPTLVGTLRSQVDRALKTSPPPGGPAPSPYVAVKVLHPGVERTVARDLRIMYAFAVLLDALPTMRWLSLPDEALTFADMMRLQLDLRIECANLATFRRNFAQRTTACFPYPYGGFAAREVLVEEFAHGVPLAAFLAHGAGPYERDVADEGLSAFLHMLLIDNFAHADLHPGNIMVRFYRPEPPAFSPLRRLLRWRPDSSPDEDAGEAEAQRRTAAHATEEAVARLAPHRGDGAAWRATLDELDREGFRPQLVFLDAGLVTQLDARNRRNFLDLFRAVAEFDGFRAGRLMAERCATPEQVIDPDVFALRVQHLVLNVKSQTFALGRVKVGDVLADVLDMARLHHVRLEGDFVNVVLSILLLEGVGRQLDPDLDLFAGALPILRQLGAQSTTSMISSGDFSMLKVWAGLEARSFLQASIESVERCVKYDLLSPNV